MSSAYARHLARQRRARADQAHVAAQHVEQLGQLVEGEAAQPAARAGDPRVVLHLEEAVARSRSRRAGRRAAPRRRHHGAELEAAERPRRRGRPGSARKRTGPRSCALIRTAATSEQRRRRAPAARASRRRRRCACRQRTAAAARGGSRWMSGRPPTGRTRTRSLGDVGDARRHDDLDVVLLEVPHDPAQSGRPSSKAPPAKKTTSASARRRPSATSSVWPRTGMPAGGLLADRRSAGSARRRPGSRATSRGAAPRRSRRRARECRRCTTRCWSRPPVGARGDSARRSRKRPSISSGIADRRTRGGRSRGRAGTGPGSSRRRRARR